MPQDPNGPSTPPPRRVVTQEERQCVLTAYESCDEWLTVAKYNNMSRVFQRLQSQVKAYLETHGKQIFEQGAFRSLTEARPTLLEDAASSSIHCIHRHLGISMVLHCQRALAVAFKMEDMQYGT
ncbi:hypothetical protein PF002_g13120 [Phytophthora fragariae]|uniref:Uncharacterized protein n=2 Tax=Phytophthora TaxID=4783 RepID=A0A6A4G799_9STRA|nr:hypothetical protein PF002_g13120 [Phytophthora fragariae]KAE9355502.1 hypothetical protein PR003_g2801 [Phytophthora rubi]